MSTITHFVDHSTNRASSMEKSRIYESFIKRVSDFEQCTKCKFDYTLILNPEVAEKRDSITLNDNIFWKTIDISKKDMSQLGILKEKLTLFRFDKVGINSMLIIVKSPFQEELSEPTHIPTSKRTSVFFDLFETKIYRLISFLGQSKSSLNFICLAGANDSAVDVFAESLSEKMTKSLYTIKINDILKDNTLLRNTLSNEKNRVILLSGFDYLFSDLNTSPAIPNRELSMLRYDIEGNLTAAAISGNIILLAVSSPLLLSKELSNNISFVEYLDQIESGDLNTFVERNFPQVANKNLLVSLFKEVPNKVIIEISQIVINHIERGLDYSVETLVQQQVNQYKQTQAEFQKVEGADFKIIEPNMSLDRVVLSKDNKAKLMMALSSIINQNLVYNIWGFAEVDSNIRSIINFYGPPGTGKTMCATAVANELSKQTGDEYQLLALNYSEIESMYVGEAPKKLERVFNFAKDKKLVLFFDEADSFLGKRIQNVSQGSEQAINSLRSTMLIQLEKYKGVVIFATNLTTNYDSAFKTRFLAEIEFPLPDKETCKQIFVKNIPSNLSKYIPNSAFTDIELEFIATNLVSLSGRDIKTIIWRVLLKASQKDGSRHIFTKDDFISEIVAYKEEKKEETKSHVSNIKSNNITTSVTPASKEMAQRLGLTDGTTK